MFFSEHFFIFNLQYFCQFRPRCNNLFVARRNLPNTSSRDRPWVGVGCGQAWCFCRHDFSAGISNVFWDSCHDVYIITHVITGIFIHFITETVSIGFWCRGISRVSQRSRSDSDHAIKLKSEPRDQIKIGAAPSN